MELFKSESPGLIYNSSDEKPHDQNNRSKSLDIMPRHLNNNLSNMNHNLSDKYKSRDNIINKSPTPKFADQNSNNYIFASINRPDN